MSTFKVDNLEVVNKLIERDGKFLGTVLSTLYSVLLYYQLCDITSVSESKVSETALLAVLTCLPIKGLTGFFYKYQTR